MRKNDSLISLYDLSFSILFIFLFISAYLIREKSQIEKRLKYDTKEFKNILQINIGEKELFNEGEYVFKDESTARFVILNSLNMLYNIWKSDSILSKKKIKNIFVIGHTDNKDIGPRLKQKYNNPNYTNWNLSLDRANQVINLIIKEEMLKDMPELSYNILLPSGKSYYMPATENLKICLIIVFNVSTINVDDNQISINYANSDQLWKYITANLSRDVIENIISFCNRSPEAREKNRRIEIRLELWE